MNLPFLSAAAANRYLPGTVADRPASAVSSADGRATTLCLVLLIATLWMATRPYLGVIHDSRFYTVQALSALLPGRFADDLYFRYGSQDQFTSFTLLYEPVLAAFGIAKAAMLLTIAGQCCWVAGLIYFARGLFRDGRTALIAVVMAVALPAGVMFNYGEQFLTPRLFAEAITLWALGSMLRGRPILALLLLGVSATVHPLMTLPGFAVLFLYEVAGRRIWWVLAAVAVLAAFALAALGVQPFVRLFERFDPAWFAVVRVRDFFCLLTEWSVFDWLKAGTILAVTGVGLTVAEPRERRLLIVVLAVALGGLAGTLIGGDLLHNVLVVDAQQYRATWLLAIVANLFVGPLLLRAPWHAMSGMTRVALVWAVGTLVATTFAWAGYFATVPVVALAGMAVAWERNRQGPIAPFARVCGVIVLALVCGTTLAGLFEYLASIEGSPALFWQTARGLGLTAVALGAIAMLVTAAPATRGATIRPLIVFAVGLGVIGAVGWDQRTPWTKFVETADAAPESLSALLPEQKLVYWDGDVRVPWFVLRRPSYVSCPQGTGALFFRGTAVTYQHRYETLQPLRTLDYGQETTCPTPPAPQPAPLERADLVSICAKEPDLGALVLTRPIANADARVWISPVEFKDVRTIKGTWRTLTTDRFYIYSCTDLQ